MNMHRKIELAFTYKRDKSTIKKDHKLGNILEKYKDTIIKYNVNIEHITNDDRNVFGYGELLYTLYRYEITCSNNKIYKELKKL